MITYKDTEKLIYNKSHFYKFTRISFDYAFQKRFYHKECNLFNLKTFSSPKVPQWIQEKNSLSNIYKNLVVIDLEHELGEKMILDYLEKYTLPNGTKLKESFVSHSLREYLLYDFKLKSFMYCIELEMDTSFVTDEGEIYLDGEEKIDFYNCIRELIVDTGENKDRNFLDSAHDIAKSKILSLINICYNLTPNSMTIRPNSGNITVVTVHEPEKPHLSSAMFQTNRVAERIEYANEIIELNESLYCFNGRFHTITTHQPEKAFHFIPVTYHAQFVWCYLDVLEEVVENVNIELQGREQFTLGENHKQLISALVTKIQLFSYHNEQFKKSIEIEYEQTYKKFEDAWQLASSQLALKEYISHLDDYLSRVQMEENEKIGQKQNGILYIISLLQILAFISIWTDFLSLLHDYGDPLVDLDSLTDLLSLINMGMPLVLIGVSFFLLFLGFKSKKK